MARLCYFTTHHWTTVFPIPLRFQAATHFALAGRSAVALAAAAAAALGDAETFLDLLTEAASEKWSKNVKDSWGCSKLFDRNIFYSIL